MSRFPLCSDVAVGEADAVEELPQEVAYPPVELRLAQSPDVQGQLLEGDGERLHVRLSRGDSRCGHAAAWSRRPGRPGGRQRLGVQRRHDVLEDVEQVVEVVHDRPPLVPAHDRRAVDVLAQQRRGHHGGWRPAQHRAEVVVAELREHLNRRGHGHDGHRAAVPGADLQDGLLGPKDVVHQLLDLVTRRIDVLPERRDHPHGAELPVLETIGVADMARDNVEARRQGRRDRGLEGVAAEQLPGVWIHEAVQPRRRVRVVESHQPVLLEQHFVLVTDLRVVVREHQRRGVRGPQLREGEAVLHGVADARERGGDGQAARSWGAVYGEGFGVVDPDEDRVLVGRVLHDAHRRIGIPTRAGREVSVHVIVQQDGADTRREEPHEVDIARSQQLAVDSAEEDQRVVVAPHRRE
mmetsp:Transcript_36629/g.96963  ORF Transcript_36629/g.96963 Transcript_36629/m.96963 type:complete len:409 (-) Transcript_36629:89-1315(-)